MTVSNSFWRQAVLMGFCCHLWKATIIRKAAVPVRGGSGLEDPCGRVWEAALWQVENVKLVP